MRLVTDTSPSPFSQVNEAAKILHEYNNRLSAEMEDRKKLTTMLKDFQAEQRDLLAQAEQRLQVRLSGMLCLLLHSVLFWKLILIQLDLNMDRT